MVSIIILILSAPYLDKGLYSTAITNLLTTILILTGVYALSENKKHIIIACLFGLPYIIFNWVNLLLFSHLPGPGALTWGVLFFIFYYYNSI